LPLDLAAAHELDGRGERVANDTGEQPAGGLITTLPLSNS
jgi:hypothetical protein